MLGRPNGPSGLAGSEDTAAMAFSALMLVGEQEYAPVEVRCKDSREDGSYRLDTSRSKVEMDDLFISNGFARGNFLQVDALSRAREVAEVDTGMESSSSTSSISMFNKEERSKARQQNRYAPDNRLEKFRRREPWGTKPKTIQRPHLSSV